MDLSSNVSKISDLHNMPNKLHTVSSDNPSYVHNMSASDPLVSNNVSSHKRHATTSDISNTNTLHNTSQPNQHITTSYLNVHDFSLHKRNHSTPDLSNMPNIVITNTPNHQPGTQFLNTKNISSNNLHLFNDFLDDAPDKSSPFKRSHTRHTSLDIFLDDNSLNWDKSFTNKNLSLDDISRTKPKLSTLDNISKLNTIDIPDHSIPNDVDLSKHIKLSNNALLCLKTLISPIAIFFHIGRLALTSITTTFSFATAFAISDLIFFSFLDNFELSYVRYILLGVTAIVSAFAIKGVISSLVNLFLCVFKGTYSWYFSLIDPNCSFSDFLFGITEITMDNS